MESWRRAESDHGTENREQIREHRGDTLTIKFPAVILLPCFAEVE